MRINEWMNEWMNEYIELFVAYWVRWACTVCQAVSTSLQHRCRHLAAAVADAAADATGAGGCHGGCRAFDIREDRFRKLNNAPLSDKMSRRGALVASNNVITNTAAAAAGETDRRPRHTCLFSWRFRGLCFAIESLRIYTLAVSFKWYFLREEESQHASRLYRGVTGNLRNGDLIFTPIITMLCPLKTQKNTTTRNIFWPQNIPQNVFAARGAARTPLQGELTALPRPP